MAKFEDVKVIEPIRTYEELSKELNKITEFWIIGKSIFEDELSQTHSYFCSLFPIGNEEFINIRSDISKEEAMEGVLLTYNDKNNI